MVKVNIVCSYRKPSRVCPKKVTNILDSKEMYTKILQQKQLILQTKLKKIGIRIRREAIKRAYVPRLRSY